MWNSRAWSPTGKRLLISIAYSLGVHQLCSSSNTPNWSFDLAVELAVSSKLLLKRYRQNKNSVLSFYELAAVFWAAMIDEQEDGNIVVGILLREGASIRQLGAVRCYQTVMMLSIVTVLLYFDGSLIDIIETTCTLFLLITWWLDSYRSGRKREIFEKASPEQLEIMDRIFLDVQASLIEHMLDLDWNREVISQLECIAVTCHIFQEHSTADTICLLRDFIAQ